MWDALRFRSPVPLAAAAAGCVAAGILCCWGGASRGLAEEIQQPQPREASAESDESLLDDSVSLPTDRNRERQLDLIQRCFKDNRWSDAATVIDDILAEDADAFFRPDRGRTTWTSVKTEARRLLDTMPRAGRQAYALQFQARAEREFDAAVADGDIDRILAVARRWFHTDSGRRAAMLVAVDRLAAGRAFSALAWLTRLERSQNEEDFEPTRSVMQAVAAWQIGEREEALRCLADARKHRQNTVRVAGRDIDLGFPLVDPSEWLATVADPNLPIGPAGGGREWWMAGGSPGRSLLTDASRPLLAARFRVPLTRHPGELELLAKRREMARTLERPLPAAGRPLVVGDTLVARSPLGLLGVDFQTGKRVWLQPGPFERAWQPEPPPEGQPGEPSNESLVTRAVDDHTSGSLASDGRMVFAVESPPEVMNDGRQAVLARGPFGRMPGPGPGTTGNRLAAYEVADDGRLRWQLPEADAQRRTDGPVEENNGDRSQRFSSEAWFLGAPLPVGGDLYALVEDRDEIRLEVIDAEDGSQLWSQPIAAPDLKFTVNQPGVVDRRLAGLSPSLGDGVLVCPTGCGAVIGIDLATRTLLWAYRYKPREADGTTRLPNGMIIQRRIVINGRMRGGRIVINGGNISTENGDEDAGWIDASPVIAGDRVIVTPPESNFIHCLGLRDGGRQWQADRRDGLFVAGIVGGRVVVVGERSVTALGLDDGKPRWRQAFDEDLADAGRISGHGILTSSRLLLPLDTPEVVQIELDDGRVSGRSRGHLAVPGNLVACRGEVVSQGIESLDVFHQTAALEKRIETALTEPDRQRPAGLAGALATLWKGRLLVEWERPAEGVDLILAAHAEDPGRVTAGIAARALVEAGLEHAGILDNRLDEALRLAERAAAEEADTAAWLEMLRLGIDTSLLRGRFDKAWELWSELASRYLADGLDGLAADLDGDRGRAARHLLDDGDDRCLRRSLAGWLASRLERLVAAFPQCAEAAGQFAADAVDDSTRFSDDMAIERLGRLERLVAAHPSAAMVRRQLLARLDSAIERGEWNTSNLHLQRELVAMRTAMAGNADRLSPPPALAASPTVSTDPDEAWPLGKVTAASVAADDEKKPSHVHSMRSLPIAGGAGTPFIENLQLNLEVSPFEVTVRDGLGRQLGGPLKLMPKSNSRNVFFNGFGPFGHEPHTALVGRILVVSVGGTASAFELAAPGLPGAVRHRRLWSLPDESVPIELGRRPGGIASKRLGEMPIGNIVSEPRPARETAWPEVRGIAASSAGIPLLTYRTITMRRIDDGGAAWSRNDLPLGSAVIADDKCVVACPRDGHAARVFSALHGGLLREAELPPTEAWLETAGRFVLALGELKVSPLGGGQLPLVRCDPLSGETRKIGLFPAASRMFSLPHGRIAVLEPAGDFSVIDLPAGRVDFRCKLPEVPDDINRLTVMPWSDRLLVLAGCPPPQEALERLNDSGTPNPFNSRNQMGMLVSGCLWAVDADDGSLLWQSPATLLQHGLDLSQPPELPVLVFARRMTAKKGRETWLSLLCIDKRTGHAVFADDRIKLGRSSIGTPDVSADPEAHTVTIGIRGHRSPLRDTVLSFKGGPISPRPPHQGFDAKITRPSLSDKIELWLKESLESLLF